MNEQMGDVPPAAVAPDVRRGARRPTRGARRADGWSSPPLYLLQVAIYSNFTFVAHVTTTKLAGLVIAARLRRLRSVSKFAATAVRKGQQRFHAFATTAVWQWRVLVPMPRCDHWRHHHALRHGLCLCLDFVIPCSVADCSQKSQQFIWSDCDRYVPKNVSKVFCWVAEYLFSNMFCRCLRCLMRGYCIFFVVIGFF